MPGLPEVDQDSWHSFTANRFSDAATQRINGLGGAGSFLDRSGQKLASLLEQPEPMERQGQPTFPGGPQVQIPQIPRPQIPQIPQIPGQQPLPNQPTGPPTLPLPVPAPGPNLEIPGGPTEFPGGTTAPRGPVAGPVQGPALPGAPPVGPVPGIPGPPGAPPGPPQIPGAPGAPPVAGQVPGGAAVTQPQSLGDQGAIPASINVPINQGPSITRQQAEAVVAGTPLEGLGGDIWDLGVRYNVDPAFALSVAKNESNYGSTPAQQRNNNIWSISNAAYGGTPVAGNRWGQYPDKKTAAEAFFRLISSEYYPNGQATVGAVMWGPNGSQTHAYAPTFENSTEYPQRLLNTMGGYGSQTAAPTVTTPSATPAPTTQTTPATAAPRPTANLQSQFGDPQLTAAEAEAVCGPAAAVRFAQAFGRNPSLREATDLAKTVGWTQGQGMAGISSQQALLQKMDLPTKLVSGAQWDLFAKEAQTGNPVVISTAAHYFMADGYNPDAKAFHVGRSGLDLRGGKEWMTADEIVAAAARLGGGAVQGALFADHPTVAAPTTITAGTSRELDGFKQQATASFRTRAEPTENAATAAITPPKPSEPLSEIALRDPQLRQLNEAVEQVGQISPRPGITDVSPRAPAPPSGPLEMGPIQAGGSPFDAFGQSVARALSQALGGLGLGPPGGPGGASDDQRRPLPSPSDTRVVPGVAARAATDFLNHPEVQSALQQVAPRAREGTAWLLEKAGQFYTPFEEDARQQIADLNDTPKQAREQIDTLRDISDLLRAGDYQNAVILAASNALTLATRSMPGGGLSLQQAYTKGIESAGVPSTAGAFPDWVPGIGGQPIPVSGPVGAVLEGLTTPTDLGIGEAAATARNAARAAATAGRLSAAGRTAGKLAADAVAAEQAAARAGASPVARRAAALLAQGRQRLPNYEPGTPEHAFENMARDARERSPDRLLHLDLNTVPKDILPLDPNIAKSSATGLVKAEAGGLPHTDDLRALFEANARKRDFYYDQADQGVPTVGEDNLEEWFALNAINSMQYPVVGQVADSIRIMGMVRQVARDARARGLSPEQVKDEILTAVRGANYPGPTGPNKRRATIKGYETGLADTGGPKTPTFAGNYGSAEARLYDPGITNDIWNFRAMNVDGTKVPAIRDGKQYMDTPHEKEAANNKQLYRGIEAVFNELGAEQGIDGFAFQSSVWDGIRAMANETPTAYQKWKAGDFKGAIAEAKAAGIFERPIGKATGKAEPGEISRAMSSDSVQKALQQWGQYLKDPIPPELGITTVQRAFLGDLTPKGALKKGAPPIRPATLEFRQGERALAESDAPLVRGITAEALQQLGVDERGVMPWLATAHRVVEETPGQYVVHLPSGNADTARYVAARVGEVTGADEIPIHYADYRSPDHAGLKFVGDPEQVRAIQTALSDAGHAAVRGPTGRSLQIPLYDTVSAPQIIETLKANGIDPASLARYTGSNERIAAADYGRVAGQLGSRFDPTTAERRGLLDRARGVLPEGAADDAAGAAAGAAPARGTIEGDLAEAIADAQRAEPERGAGNVPAAKRSRAPRLIQGAAGLTGIGAGWPEDDQADDPNRGLKIAAALLGGVAVLGAARSFGRARRLGGTPPASVLPPGAIGHAAPTTGPASLQLGNNLKRAFTFELTDRNVLLNQAQHAYSRALGRPLNATEEFATLQRMQPGQAAQQIVEDLMGPHIRAAGDHYASLQDMIVAKANLQVANVMQARHGATGARRVFPGGMTAASSQTALNDLQRILPPDVHHIIDQASDAILTDVPRWMRDRMVDSGVWTPARAAQLDADYPIWAKTHILDYMETQRAAGTAGKLGTPNDGLEQYTVAGTARTSLDRLASNADAIYRAEALAHKNEVFSALIGLDDELAATTGTREFVPVARTVPEYRAAIAAGQEMYQPGYGVQGGAGQSALHGFINGEARTYIAKSPEIAQMINRVDTGTLPGWARWPANVVRAGATSRNPAFLLGNTMLDVPQYFLQTTTRGGGRGLLDLPVIAGELARSYWELFGIGSGLGSGRIRSAGAQEFMRGGGGFSAGGFYGGGPASATEAIRKLRRPTAFSINSGADARQLLNDFAGFGWVSALGQRAELAPRVAAMRVAQRRGLTGAQAVLQGRTVTMDFDTAGRAVKWLNQIVPFTNVGVQGTAMMGRLARDHPVALPLTATALIGIPAFAAEVNNHSTPELEQGYADIPNYIKDTSMIWMLPGRSTDQDGNSQPNYIALNMRGWAPAMIPAKELAARLAGREGSSWSDMARQVWSAESPIGSGSYSNFASSFIPPVIGTAFSLSQNRDYFRDAPIMTERANRNASSVSQALSGPLTDLVSSVPGYGDANIQPSAIDFAARDIGGGLANVPLGASDLAAGRRPRSDAPGNIPVAGGFAGRLVRTSGGQIAENARSGEEVLHPDLRRRLRDEGLPTNLGPVQSTIRNMPLRQREQAQFQIEANREVNLAVKSLLDSPDFATYTPHQKERALARRVGLARERAARRIMAAIPEESRVARRREESSAF